MLMKVSSSSGPVSLTFVRNEDEEDEEQSFILGTYSLQRNVIN